MISIGRSLTELKSLIAALQPTQKSGDDSSDSKESLDHMQDIGTKA